MKRLVVCCDGTWNNAEQEANGIPTPTNVFKLFNLVLDRDTENNFQQLKYYHPGVGGEGGLANKILGGVFADGLDRHICSAYHWLGSHYEEGDEIFLYGFSRGAFTARSLSGFLALGLLDLHNLEPDNSWNRVHTAYEEGYRPQLRNHDWNESGWKLFHDRKPCPIRFVGVWDTVGTLGIPDDLEIFNLFDDKAKWEFHNTNLGSHIQTARHAMAMDELRSCFSITRWSNANVHGDAVELWFPGAHSDVGGGYAECGLSETALEWMVEESVNAGLKVRDNFKRLLSASATDVLHNSYKGVFAKLRSRPRSVPALVPENKEQGIFHESAYERQKISPIAYAPYRPTKQLEKGERLSVDVFAKQHWNVTNLFLRTGEQYRFSATGEWKDEKDACDWKGTDDDKFTRGDIARTISSFIGSFESFFKERNPSTDFLYTKRVEEFGWFCLVGAIANDRGGEQLVNHDGSPLAHEYVDLSRHEITPFTVTHPGYLFCFANDVWSKYDNNSGSVRLTIERVA